MSIMRFDPFRDLAQMQDRINRIFGDAYTRQQEDLGQRGAWLPAVDIYETPDQTIVIKAEVPGVAREDIDVRVEHNTLTLRGERKHEVEIPNDQFHRVERLYGAFSRTFALPNRVDTDAVTAEVKDGVLTITLPVKAEARPRQVEIAAK